MANTSVPSAALQAQALALRGGSLGGPPLILSPRLQQIPTTSSMALLNGGPPPLISADQTQQLLYAQYGIADYGNYATGLTSPLLADYQAHADAAGGLFAR